MSTLETIFLADDWDQQIFFVREYYPVVCTDFYETGLGMIRKIQTWMFRCTFHYFQAKMTGEESWKHFRINVRINANLNICLALIKLFWMKKQAVRCWNDIEII